PPRSVLGAIHVVRPRGAGVVRLRVGDSAPRNGLPGDLPLPPPRRAAFRATRSAHRDHLALPLAHLPHHGGRSAHQAPRRLVLARPHRALLSLRTTADPQSAEPLVPLPAARGPEGRGPLQLRRGAGGPVVRVLPATVAAAGGRGDGALPAEPRAERKPV